MTGLPSINIEFKKRASTLVSRGSKGVVALVLRDATNNGVKYITDDYDIPTTFSDDNQKYIKLCLVGNVYKPRKIVISTINADSDIQTALDLLELEEFDYLAVPSIQTDEKVKVKTFINKMRTDIKYKARCVMNDASDAEYVVNFSTNDIVMEKFGNLSNAEFCCFVAGFIAGTPMSQSITYAVPNGVTGIPVQTKIEAGNKVKAGELLLIKEAGSIRFARGINSLTTLTDTKTEDFQKIKLMDIMDLMFNDMRGLAIKNYIGKMPNSYDNKCKLIIGYNSYLDVLVGDELVENDYFVGINIEKQKNYLKSIGIDVDDMTEQEIKEENTKDKVFLKVKCNLIDSTEEIDMDVEI
ncbi:phage tail sheath family protein [[Clostridium] bifermentans ATCC 638]|uniref:Phage tail sheath family protein n=1 Tax=Paraclostridium bifermentans ATCC 638 = DSM 14991 TaxID=1233171 RepID=T4VPT3_PARBF|nr:phage tail sheath subtilisin-like domain-containing protein [Paraclostridium bifermentans]EQK42771.1 phage tail sheath family protein [[Clostridium] bifermentans ATCC 638] [Paraclostridium bifermentans ATCC 638 = DSM 14991]RIZ58450.1 hypothetical protein CHH45_11535 [Paraclostridium bifermentans]UAG19569.1 phage tail sheath subtilisin-like domain-containing protein [Paraclostridium bifermentans]